MVVVRESPSAKLSPEKNKAQWPPQSPFQALISSPSGRKRWQSRHDRSDSRSLSPSPAKTSLASARVLQALSQPSDDEEDDEDEETLQLKLAEIQAKLRLKELQKKAKKDNRDEEKECAGKADDKPRTRLPRYGHKSESTPDRDVQVPLSPTKRNLEPAPGISPARARLGIAAALRADDVSLKRPKAATTYTAHALRRSESATELGRSEKPKSFSERLAASRVRAEDHEAKQKRIEHARSTGFRKRTPPPAARSISPVREQPVKEFKSHSARLSRERSRSPRKTDDPPRPTRNPNFSEGEGHRHNASKDASSGSSYDPFSELHLTKRHISHVDVAREMEGREIYTLPRLLKEVKSPHYDPPECEGDFVVFGILASKSTPYDQKAAHRTSDEHKPQEDPNGPRNKFMVLKICDLKWEVDCFLFGSAFDQFWKLTPGTLLAILNPGVMPPKTNQHNGRFSLKLGSSEDCVMEIGLARDLAYCASVKANGEQCSDWVDKRSAELCEFHLNLMIDKQRKGRMEVNTMHAVRGNPGDRHKSKNLGENGFDKHHKDKNKQGSQSHREYGKLYSVPKGMGIGKSIASLLDAEDQGTLQDKTDGEASRKRIAAAQKERDLARRLGEMGRGVGAEYMRKNTANSMTSTSRSTASTTSKPQNDVPALFDKPKASDLGLLNNKASDIHLSPAKDRKAHFGLGFEARATTAGGAKAMGWGSAKRAGVLQPKEKSPERERGQMTLQVESRPRSSLVRGRSQEGTWGSLSPRKKKARFELPSGGIKEPGRESMGKGVCDDDDDLDIV